MKNLVIFASGTGSNAENIIRYFNNSGKATVAAIFSNNSDAGVIQIAKMHRVPVVVFTKEELKNGEILQQLVSFKPDLIVLAGFLLMFPQYIIEQFPNKIINIHPALLPKYGGKGMYGMHVHNAVLSNKETETGITIHYVDEHYDEGDIIFSKNVALSGKESAAEVAEKVRQLEQMYFPMVIEKLLNQ